MVRSKLLLLGVGVVAVLAGSVTWAVRRRGAQAARASAVQQNYDAEIQTG